MSTSKWKGAAALAYTGDVSTVGATPKVYPIAETIDAKGEPVTYERVTSQQPDVLNINRAGFNYSFSVDGMQASCGDLGYLAWLAFGGQAYATFHTISPADDTGYFNFRIDRKLDLGTSQPTEEYAGCRIGSLSFEQPLRDYARVSFNGFAVDKGSPTAALSPTVPTDADNQPLDWGALGAGFLKLGYDGAATAQDNTVQSFKFELTRNQAYAGFKVNTGQPGAVLEGGRRLTFELTREFSGAEAQAEYASWAANEHIEVDVQYTVGAHRFRFNFHELVVTGSYAGEVGAGEDAIMATLVATAVKPDGGQLATIEVVDDTLAVYT